MKIQFDKNIKVAGIGLVPWTRLGPERWLPNYVIASLYSWDLDGQPGLPTVYCATTHELPKANTANLLNAPDFQNLVTSKLEDYALLPYKSVTVPSALKHRHFLAEKSSFAKTYENKAKLRELFKDEVNFPLFRIYDSLDLESFTTVMDGQEQIILQDEILSGGRGTYKVTNAQEYAVALENLPKNHQIVASHVITGAKERSIQACVTKKGVFTGPLQRQIVNSPLLAHKTAGDKFCGGEIITIDQGTQIHQQAQQIAETIGKHMQQAGYKGIFGVDFLLNEQNQLFTLEVNARITGMTPLLAALCSYDDLPFYLLHILELGGYDYQITDTSVGSTQQGSLVILHSQDNQIVRVDKIPSSGTYDLVDGQLHQVSRNISLLNLRDDQFIIERYVPTDTKVKPGGRLAVILTSQPVLDENTDELYNSMAQTVAKVYQQIITSTV